MFVRDGRSFTRKFALAFIETSALDTTGVDTAFQRILQEICKMQMKKQLKRVDGGGTNEQNQHSVSHGQAISLHTNSDEPDVKEATKGGMCC